MIAPAHTKKYIKKSSEQTIVYLTPLQSNISTQKRDWGDKDPINGRFCRKKETYDSYADSIISWRYENGTVRAKNWVMTR